MLNFFLRALHIVTLMLFATLLQQRMTNPFALGGSLVRPPICGAAPPVLFWRRGSFYLQLESMSVGIQLLDCLGLGADSHALLIQNCCMQKHLCDLQGLHGSLDSKIF